MILKGVLGVTAYLLVGFLIFCRSVHWQMGNKNPLPKNELNFLLLTALLAWPLISFCVALEWWNLITKWLPIPSLKDVVIFVCGEPNAKEKTDEALDSN